MNPLEKALEQLLDEHQRENELHVIGGRRQLVERLLALFESWQAATPSAGNGLPAPSKTRIGELAAIALEIATDPWVDLVTKERRLRLCSALRQAGLL